MLDALWTPNVAPKAIKINQKNNIEQMWFRGGPRASELSRARVQKEQLSKRFGYLEDWKIGRLEERRKGWAEEWMIGWQDDRMIG
jgi:hypothetical protein